MSLGRRKAEPDFCREKTLHVRAVTLRKSVKFDGPLPKHINTEKNHVENNCHCIMHLSFFFRVCP